MASTSSHSGAEAVECAVCYLAAGDAVTPLRATACGHTYCEQCIGLYTLKVPPPALVLCPLCRTPLGDADLPVTLTVTLMRTNRPLGVEVQKSRDEEHVSISHVEQGSLAAEAGLRVGMTLLSVNGVPLITVSDVAGSVLACPLGAPISLVVGRLRAPQSVPPPVDRSFRNDDRRETWCLAACCCFCNVMPQLWQRALFPTKPWVCLTGACLLWVCVGVSSFFDSLGTDMARRERITSNATITGWQVALARANMHEWTNADFSDGLNQRSELYALLSVLALLSCWAVGGCMLYSAGRRLRRTEPQVWESAMISATAGERRLLASPVGAFCCCCTLASNLINGLIPSSNRYLVCAPLPLHVVAPVPAQGRPPERQPANGIGRGSRVDTAPLPMAGPAGVELQAPTSSAPPSAPPSPGRCGRR